MNIFKKKSKSDNQTKSKKEVNPYLDARNTWNDRVALLVSGQRQWQLVSVLSLLIAVGSLGAYIYESNQSSYIPYIVEVDKLGQTAAVSIATKAQPVDPIIIKSYLASFIQNARMVTPDSTLQRKAIYDVFAVMENGSSATNKMTNYLNGNPKTTPFARAESETVSIQIDTVLPQTESSWQVTWFETTTDRDGVQHSAPTRWTALITIAVSPPDQFTTEEQILRNPVGLYVTDYSWAKQN